MTIIRYDPESYSLTTEDRQPLPAFITRGCGCCQRHIPVTAESIKTAKQEAREWLAELESIQPADYSKLAS